MVPAFIYFDLDDTLLNHRRAEQEALLDIYHQFDIFESVNADQLVRIYHRVNSEQWIKYGRSEVTREQLQRNRFELTLRALQLDGSVFEEVGTQYMKYYQKHWQWMAGARQAFDKIRGTYKTGILTNGFAETQEKKFEQFDLYDKAQHLVITENVGKLKPHPKVFEYATTLTGHNPEEILYIGDSYSSDVIGGTDYGWKVAWFTKNGDAQKTNKADFVFDNFDDLCLMLNVQG